MSVGEYLLGLAFLAGTAGSVVAAAVIVCRRSLPHLRGSTAVLAGAAIATFGLIWVHLLPGAFGILSRWSALALALGVLAAAWWLAPRAVARDEHRAPEPPLSEGVGVVLAVLAVGALVLLGIADAWDKSAVPSVSIDTLTHHLPNVAKWIQTGSVWRVDQFVPLLANGNYPQGGDVVILAAALPFRSDAFVRLVDYPYLALAGLSVYSLGIELRASRAASALAGALFVTIPVVLLPGIEGTMTDPVFLAGFGTGLLFLLRRARTCLTSDLVIAGVGLGVAFGTKWYAVPAVAAAVLVFAGQRLVTTRKPGVVLREGAVLAALVALGGGFWLLRNAVLSGSPFYPAGLKLGGLDVFDVPKDFIRACSGKAVIQYLGDFDVLRRDIWPGWRDAYGLPVAVLGVLGLLGLGRRRPVVYLAVLSLVLAFAYTVTPFTAFGIDQPLPRLVSANARYLLPALLAVAALAAAGLSRMGRWRIAGELGAAVGIGAGIRRGFELPALLVAETAGVLLLISGAGAAIVAVAKGRRRVLAGALAAGLLLLAAVGYARQRDFGDQRYEQGEPAIAWVARNAPGGHRIALAGQWDTRGAPPVFPMFGPRMRNDVDYVGVRSEGQLRPYLSRGPWLDALRRGRYDLVLVSVGGFDNRCPAPWTRYQENRWARDAGFRLLASSPRMSIWRVDRLHWRR